MEKTFQYRRNAQLEVLRAEYESIRSRLEEIANDNNELVMEAEKVIKRHQALINMGFQRKDLETSKITLSVYVREEKGKTEILSYYDLNNPTANGPLDKTPYLYETPTSFNAWYKSTYLNERLEFKKNNENKEELEFLAATITCGSAIAVTVYFLNPSTTEYVIASIISGVLSFGSSKIVTKLLKRNPLEKELVASGPKALEHIAANTTFDEFVKYNGRLRIEEQKEYYAKLAELEARATEEAERAERLGNCEEQRIKWKNIPR